MSKKWSESFAVSYRQPGHPRITVLGVTAIVPQCGNLVFHTEDQTQFVVSENQLLFGEWKTLMSVNIEFTNEDTINEVLAASDDEDEIVIDHRKCNNSDWHPCTYDEYGTERLLVNEKKEYTFLFNPKASFNPYCVAFKYDAKTGTWEQGHYFDSYKEALEFMYSID